jgi:hypothetical protein
MGGLSKYNNSTFHNFNANDSLLDLNVFSVAIDPSGHKWVGTWYGMSRYNSSDSWVANYRMHNGLYNSFIRDIDADTQGNIWIGMFADYNQDGGITSFNGTSWKSYTVSDGLVNAQVIRMAIDKQNNLWIATGGGVSKLTIYQGINDYYAENSFEVYPNPAKDHINIIYSETVDRDEQFLEIFNSLGQKIYVQSIVSEQGSISVPLNNLENGVYFVKINNYTRKILVNK